MTNANDTDVYYDPYDLTIAADPWPTYARLRDEAPIYYNERVRLLGTVPILRRRAGPVELGDVLQQQK